MGKRIVLIPAYKPEDKMLRLLESLKEYQDAEKEADREIDGILVVDDGGQESFRALFEAAEAMGCRVVHHRENRGKGAAIRTGLQAAMEFFGPDIHVVTADADGQHLPADIVRIARTLSEKNGKTAERPALVLGVRDFSGKEVPARSMLGNRITAAFFRFATGTACSDTQTGLRGIPAALLTLALETEGDRYEYEMNFLTEAVKCADLIQIPIQTVKASALCGSSGQQRTCGLGALSDFYEAVRSFCIFIRDRKSCRGFSRSRFSGGKSGNICRGSQGWLGSF